MTPSPAHKHLFYAEIAKLVGAGFDIRRAAAVLLDTRLPASQVALLKNLHRGLDAGESITTAFERGGNSITGLERCIIGAGERGGKLAPAFQHLADYFGMLAAVRRDLVRGMIYPLIVLHLGVIIAIVPAVLMAGTMTFGQILGSLMTTLLILYAVAFISAMAVRMILRAAPENAVIDRLINWVPWIGTTRKNLAMARFCRVYHSCLLAGISMRETVQLSSGAAQSGMIQRAGARLAKVVKDGGALGPPLMAEDAFPKAFARSYSTGEEAGTLDKDLAGWSKVFQQDAAASARTMSVMVPKVLYFFILAFVAWKVVGFFGGYYEGLDQIIPIR
ncbi:MAG: type II secretion system F family protein [Luteolibacter sp.]